MPSDAFESFCEENQAALDSFCSRFADYEPLQGFNSTHLRAWLRQFQAQHRLLALKLVKAIAYYGTGEVNALMASLKKSIDDQIIAEKADPKSVLYVPLGRAGESGTDILRRFRNVNKLQSLQKQFITLVELPEKLFAVKNPILFFFDDFIGTGKQVCEAWAETVSQVAPEYLPMYLAVFAAFKDGITRVEVETPLHVIAVHTLGPRYQLMESACHTFSAQEKNTLKRYCEQAENEPLGFGKLGLLVSFAYGTPNNTISIIRGSQKQKPWRGLLPRWEDLN
jgi:hypothetical protein